MLIQGSRRSGTRSKWLAKRAKKQNTNPRLKKLAITQSGDEITRTNGWRSPNMNEIDAPLERSVLLPQVWWIWDYLELVDHGFGFF